jgi:hypothetical protein
VLPVPPGVAGDCCCKQGTGGTAGNTGYDCPGAVGTYQPVTGGGTGESVSCQCKAAAIVQDMNYLGRCCISNGRVGTYRRYPLIAGYVYCNTAS